MEQQWMMMEIMLVHLECDQTADLGWSRGKLGTAVVWAVWAVCTHE